MGILIGLDIGGSTTKVVTLTGNQLGDYLLVQANDPVASAYGAVGKWLDIHQQTPDCIDRIVVTGVGASYLKNEILGRETKIVSEFTAVGLGGLHLAGKEAAIVVSMGTGTSIVDADANGVTHLIGSGVGGGTVLGLAESMLKLHDFDSFESLLETGKIRNVDLTIGDITIDEIPGLSKDTTASNFGKVNDLATPSDLAVGIVNLVFQSVGTAAVLCARQRERRTVVFTGNLTRIKFGQQVLCNFANLYGIEMLVPEHSQFATAVGAVLLGR